MGDTSLSHLTLENISNLVLSWQLTCLDYQVNINIIYKLNFFILIKYCFDKLKDFFEFPLEGELQPLEIAKIEIKFKPTHEILLNTQFSFKIKDGNDMYCELFLIHYEIHIF